ncbi:NAD(P)H-dependent oxidoreductase [Nonomuraea sp. B10E15]|uniref:NADPH-dependent FMN reductase n=1 Tax=Nonomuraea sp. B10E15 TaxID=3153560 RepID=UPI00325E67FE
MTRIAIIVGSTRPGRRAMAVAQWVHESAQRHDAGATFDILDVADFGLPLLDETNAAIFGSYEHPHTVRWATAIDSHDGFVFVTPEYNHSFPAALKNAIDFLFREWNDKAAAIVSYGLQQGVRAAEQLRLVLAEVKVATVRSQTALSVVTDFAGEDSPAPGSVSPSPHQQEALTRMLDEVVAWSGALRSLRVPT